MKPRTGVSDVPKMSDYEEFLDSTMIDEGDAVVLLTEGEFREPEETGLSRTVFQIRVQIPDGRKKIWTMNKTTRRQLAKAWGDDSANWINKRVKIRISPQNVRGEIKDVLYGEPSDKIAEVPPEQKTIDTRPSESTVKVDAIINDIVSAKPDLSIEAIERMVAEQKKNFGNMINEEAAAILVATNLGVYKEGKPIQ